MATSFLALLDDVATIAKISMKKTLALSVDDLAVNAGSANGLDPAREWPIVAKVAMGSLINKAILIPVGLLVPEWAMGPVLGLGGLFLAYEGMAAHSDEEKESIGCEATRVKEAVGTDAVLSAEIMAVAMGDMAGVHLLEKALALSLVGVGMTMVVYGSVALLVKIDDAGRFLKFTGWRKTGSLMEESAAPILKVLGHVGVIAMLIVAGSLIAHNFMGLNLSWWQSLVVGASVGKGLSVFRRK